MNLLLKPNNHDRVIENCSIDDFLKRLEEDIEFDEGYAKKPYSYTLPIPKKKYYGIKDENFIAFREKSSYLSIGIGYFITTYIRITDKKRYLSLKIKTELSIVVKILYAFLILFSCLSLSSLFDSDRNMHEILFSIGLFIGINAVLFLFIPYQFEKKSKRILRYFF